MRRAPSNRMRDEPSDGQKDSSCSVVLLWGVLILPFMLLLLLLWLAPLFTLFILFVVAVGVAVNYLFEWVKQCRLARQRPGQTICEFARDFNCREVDTWTIRATYKAIQEWLPVKDFPVRASDRLTKDYGFDGADIDEVYFAASALCRRSADDIENSPYYARVVTVRDLVLCLNHQPRVAS